MKLNQLLNTIGAAYIALSARIAVSTWTESARPPCDAAMVHAGGSNAYRVLLVGGASAVGFGTVTHELALAGHLARQTSALTGRGLDVEVKANAAMTAPRVRAFLATTRLTSYDAIVLTIGTREAYEFLPVAVWRRQLGALLDLIAASGSPPPAVVIVGAETDISVPLPAWMARRGASRAAQINDVSRQIADRLPHVSYVESALVTGPKGSPEIPVQELYTTAARGIAPALALALGGPPRQEPPNDEDARLKAVARMRPRGSPADDDLNQLVTLAKDLMGASAAALYVVEADRVWSRVADGLPLDEHVRSVALCSEALDHREGLVVSDLREDPIYRSRSYVVGPPYVRFYVGYPVLSPDGYRVAAFSIFDTRPRTFRPAHAILLRQFARRAGAMLFDQT